MAPLETLDTTIDVGIQDGSIVYGGGAWRGRATQVLAAYGLDVDQFESHVVSQEAAARNRESATVVHREGRQFRVDVAKVVATLGEIAA